MQEWQCRAASSTGATQGAITNHEGHLCENRAVLIEKFAEVTHGQGAHDETQALQERAALTKPACGVGARLP